MFLPTQKESNMGFWNMLMAWATNSGKNARELYFLGKQYAMGIKVSKNQKRAFEYFKKAAEKGHMIAQLELFGYYNEMRNYERALYFLTEASKQGEPFAQNFLIMMYMEGEICKQDFNKAISLAYISAKSGNPLAQFILGSEFYSGNHIKKDINQGVFWLEKSAEQGYKNAFVVLKNIYEKSANGNELLWKFDKMRNQNNPSINLFYRKGMEYYNDGDIFTALKYFTQAKETGEMNSSISSASYDMCIECMAIIRNLDK